MSKDMKKENTNGAIEKELQEEEVNGFCSCRTQAKIHCNHDCVDGSALITTAQ